MFGWFTFVQDSDTSQCNVVIPRVGVSGGTPGDVVKYLKKKKRQCKTMLELELHW